MSALQQRLEAPLIDDELHAVRRRALKALMQYGFPDLKTEAWKYTSLRQLDKREAGQDPGLGDGSGSRPELPFAAAGIELRAGVSLPDGVRLEPLDADELNDLKYGGREDAFAWLNLARVEQPWCLHIERDPGLPLVLAQSTAADFTGDRHSFLRIEVAEGVNVTLIDWQQDAGAGLVNQVQTLELAPGSRLDHIVARSGAESAIIQRTEARVEAGADYRFTVLDQGGPP